jgi:hypothetical protein
MTEARKQKPEPPPQPSADEVLRRMLATPPDPRVKKTTKKTKKRAK